MGVAECPPGMGARLLGGGCAASGASYVVAMDHTSGAWSCTFGPENAGTGDTHVYCLVP